MRKLVFIAIAIIGLVFTSNSFGQIPGARKTTIKKTKVQTQRVTPNSSPISSDIRTKVNRRRFDHIGNVKDSSAETNRNRKPKAKNFGSGPILEGSNIHRKRPRKTNSGKRQHKP